MWQQRIASIFDLVGPNCENDATLVLRRCGPIPADPQSATERIKKFGERRRILNNRAICRRLRQAFYHCYSKSRSGKLFIRAVVPLGLPFAVLTEQD